MAKIRNYEKGFLAIHLINLGNELGIFDVLSKSDQGISVPELASELGLHEPYVRIWCQTAFSFEIIDCDHENRFTFQPYLNDLLGNKSSNTNYLANISMNVIVGQDITDAAPYFRTGKIREFYATPEYSEIIYNATRNICPVYPYLIFPKHDHLHGILKKGGRFLDIGCGNGNLITQLARKYKNSTFVGVNPDKFGIEKAEKNISRLQLADRVSVRAVGGEQIDGDEDFDIVNLMVTLHEISPDTRQKVVEKAYQVLKRDGYLSILDFPYPDRLEDFRNPHYEYGIFDQFYETIWGTVHLSAAEKYDLLSGAGFKTIQSESIIEGTLEFMTAVK